MTYTRYVGQRGDNYTVTEEYTDSQGKRQTRSVTRIRWSTVAGEVQHFFDDVLICASQALPEKLVRKVPPWDLDSLTPFQTDFLANFKTERYTVDLEQGFEQAKEVMETEIERLIRRDIGGDHQRINSKFTNYVGITFKHILLPIWLAHYRYRNDGYQILVNARTGKVVGDRPWSWMKIIRLIIVILVLAAAAWWAFKTYSGKSNSGKATQSKTAIPLCDGERTPSGSELADGGRAWPWGPIRMSEPLREVPEIKIHTQHTVTFGRDFRHVGAAFHFRFSYEAATLSFTACRCAFLRLGSSELTSPTKIDWREDSNRLIWS
jgi:hypothetical protein